MIISLYLSSAQGNRYRFISFLASSSFVTSGVRQAQISVPLTLYYMVLQVFITFCKVVIYKLNDKL
jgi:hypothetical protein